MSTGGTAGYDQGQPLRPPRLVEVPVVPVVPEAPTGGDATDGDPTASDQVVVPKRLSGWAGFWISVFGAVLITVVVSQLADLMPLLFLRA